MGLGLVGVPLGAAVALTAGLTLGHGVRVGLGEAEPLAAPEGVGVTVGFWLGEGLGVGLTDGDAPTDAEAVGETLGAHGVGVAAVSTAVLPAVLVDWWVSSSAAGTMMMPSATVMTKASAPHSRRQKAHEDLRIRGLRPFPGPAYSGC